MRQDELKPHEIRWLRRTMGLTQAQFGDFFGRDAATIFRWEDGRYEPEPGSKAALIMLWNDVEQKLDLTGLDPDALQPSPKLPDEWREIIGQLMLGGLFLYLINKMYS